MRLFACVALLFALFILPGCRGESEAGKIVIHVGNWGGAKEGNEFDKLIDKIYSDFEKENPGVLIREQPTPGSQEYVAKMSLAFIAKSEPEIMALDASSAALFINSRMVMDLKPLIEKDKEFHESDFFPNVFNIARRGGAQYAIPQDFTPMVVYYNKKLFDKAGLPYPTADWNFAKFREIAKKLTIPGDKPEDPPKQYGFAFANWMPGWVMWLWNNGADHMSPDGKTAIGYLDSPKSVEAVQFLADIILKDRSAPSISQAAAQGVDQFANGEAAMTVSGHWAMIGYKAAPKGPDGLPKITWDDLGVVAMPHNTPEPQTVMYESGYAIGAHCKYPEAAWKFIKYMTSYRIQKLYQSSGIAVCARKDVAEERAKLSALEAGFMPIIPSARPPYGSRIEGYEFVEAQGQKAMDSILQNGRSPQEALTKAAKRIDREFAKK